MGNRVKLFSFLTIGPWCGAGLNRSSYFRSHWLGRRGSMTSAKLLRVSFFSFLLGIIDDDDDDDKSRLLSDATILLC